MIELMVISICGQVNGFTFMLPGPAHHARWMSKCLYYMKMRMLSNVFNMTEEEKLQDMNCLVGPESWLIFVLLGLTGPQV